jgi:mannose-1-phosphate guanylyltransferase/phosphomannomutase
MDIRKKIKPKVVVVAGGLATRMKPLIEDIPKCLIELNGKPLIQYQIEFFKKCGFTDFIFCIGHLADKVKAYFEDGSNFGVNIKYSQEDKQLLGTAGAVKLIEELIPKGEDFIVYYGDSITSMNFNKFLRFHIKAGGIATVCIRPLPKGYKSSSVIILEENKKIQLLLEKPKIEEIEKYRYKKKYINNGIYLFKKEVLKFIPENTKYDFAKQVFPLIIEKGSGIYGYPTEEYFREIGRIEKYEKFLEEIKSRKNIL